MCSSEVGNVLGISPENFLGQALNNFALPPHSELEIEAALNGVQVPAELYLDYQHRSGELVAVSFYIFATKSPDGDPVGWHGFASTLIPLEQEPIDQEETITNFSQLASAIILDILGNIRKNNSIIAESPNSNVTVNEQRVLLDEEGSLVSFENHILEIEHKLIWGNKLDLDHEEDLYIRKNKFRSTGIRGLIQRLRAPRKIAKNDLRWIAVVLRVEDIKSYIWFNYPQGNKDDLQVDLPDFLNNPDTLHPEIDKAINDPWKVITIYEVGTHYLRRPDA
jgi:hypothetical protein